MEVKMVGKGGWGMVKQESDGLEGDGAERSMVNSCWRV